MWNAIVLLCLIPLSSSYRFGDFVETDLVIDAEKVDAYRHQMPRFGVDHHSTTIESVTQHLGLQFDDGLFVLPVYPVTSKMGNLVRLDVEIYSDESNIQNVIGTPTYSKTATDPTKGIAVTYAWNMQSSGNEHSLSILYTVTVFACCWIILVSSGVLGGNDSSILSQQHDTATASTGAPKWD